MMVRAVDEATARRAFIERMRAQQARQAHIGPDKYPGFGQAGREPIPQILKRPSGLGVQIDAMIQRLKDDGHSPENIARVMRLRADKIEEGAE